MNDLSRNYNHLKSGDTIKVEPIRNLQAISKIKTLLLKQPRNYCLFVLGINTAFRASELLSIRVGHVAHLLPGDILEIKQQKQNSIDQLHLTRQLMMPFSYGSKHAKLKH